MPPTENTQYLPEVTRDLAKFGLNPSDWRPLRSYRPKRHRGDADIQLQKIILGHRFEQDLRLSVALQKIPHQQKDTEPTKPIITDVLLFVL
ncbi:MAG: hypothetical protein RBT63_04705 [Bdellovibrionales bacterium]|jgi:hypothetical protein|nr:hypothetical protein [Bdellovibrionales bacterium]